MIDDTTRQSLENLEMLWEQNDCDAADRRDDLLANIIDDEEDYIDEFFDPDEFE